MCDDGYINDYGKLETSGGRHPNLYGLNPESGYFLGVDIKRFAVNIGLINFKGDMVELKMNIPYNFENSIEGMNELCKLIINFIKKLTINKEKILNINVNVSGRVNPESGYSFSQFNFEERPLADVLSEKLGYKVNCRQRYAGYDLWRVYARLRKRRKRYYLCKRKLGIGNRNYYRWQDLYR